MEGGGAHAKGCDEMAKTVSIKGVGFLRTVPPFVTAHSFWASQVWSEVFKFLNEFAY